MYILYQIYISDVMPYLKHQTIIMEELLKTRIRNFRQIKNIYINF